MERRVAALLRIWEAEGVRVEWTGQGFAVVGMDCPPWWSDWTERHRKELFSLLNLTAPEPERVPLREDQPVVWNELSGPADLNRPKHTPAPPEFMAALAALAEYGVLRGYQ